ncbi:MAG: hypothetical protein GX879_01650, partial [Bacteroidales bacterium]|nr:hypothetical protein [Bacteroidales bacterium]
MKKYFTTKKLGLFILFVLLSIGQNAYSKNIFNTSAEILGSNTWDNDNWQASLLLKRSFAKLSTYNMQSPWDTELSSYGSNSAIDCPNYASTVSSTSEYCSGQTYYFKVKNTFCTDVLKFHVVGNYGTWGGEITWIVESNLTGNIVASGGPGANGAN